MVIIIQNGVDKEVCKATKREIVGKLNAGASPESLGLLPAEADRLQRKEPPIPSMLHMIRNPGAVAPPVAPVVAPVVVPETQSQGVTASKVTTSKKLDANKVREIRSLKGTMSQKAIGAQFGIGKSTVGDILSGKTWKNVA